MASPEGHPPTAGAPPLAPPLVERPLDPAIPLPPPSDPPPGMDPRPDSVPLPSAVTVPPGTGLSAEDVNRVASTVVALMKSSSSPLTGGPATPSSLLPVPGTLGGLTIQTGM